MKKTPKLTAKQKSFCREYIVDYNATQAAIRAGYSEKTARTIGANLLTLMNIQEEIRELNGNQQARTEITSDMVLKELGRIAFSDIRDMYSADGSLIDIKSLSDDAAATVSGFEVDETWNNSGDDAQTKKIKRYDKIRALEILAKRFGLDKPTGEESGNSQPTQIIFKVREPECKKK